MTNTFTTADGSIITAYPVISELADGTAVVEVVGGGHVAAGAFAASGGLLKAAKYVEERFGGEVTVDKKGVATVAAPNLPKGSDDRGAGLAYQYEQEQIAKKAAARKGFTARKSTSSKSGGAKGKKTTGAAG